MSVLLQNRSHADDIDLENRIYLLEKDLEQKPDLAKYIVPAALKTAKDRYKQFIQQEDLIALGWQGILSNDIFNFPIPEETV